MVHIVFLNFQNLHYKMFNLKKINKTEFGKLIIPVKIYNFNYKKEIEKLYEKLYFDNLNYLIIINLFFGSFLFSFGLYILIYPQIYFFLSSYILYNFIYKYLILLITGFILNLIIYYFFLLIYLFYNDSKFKKIELEIEKDLPEFIDNLVSNLKGGISLEKALLKSVRIEQKALFNEVSLINEKIIIGKNVNEALHEFSERFNSPIIKRTFFLIEEGISGGGNLAKPLERISNNLKRIYELDNEIKASSGGFAMVIKIISIIVGPILFALALTLLTFIGQLFSLLSRSNSNFLSVSQIPPEFAEYLIVFSYSMIILITLFSSLIISQIKNEKTYEAMKYIPIYVIISIILFNIVSGLLLDFFSGIITWTSTIKE